MRLIDADELMEMLRAYKHCPFGLSIDEVPTVEAIPVEWVKKWAKFYKVINAKRYDTIRLMLEEWEKENEAD